MDFFMAPLGKVPYRCQRCTARFYVRRADLQPAGMEKKEL